MQKDSDSPVLKIHNFCCNTTHAEKPELHIELPLPVYQY